MRPLLLAVAAVAATALAAEPTSAPLPPAAAEPQARLAGPPASQAKPAADLAKPAEAQPKPGLKVTPLPEGKRATAGSTSGAPPKAPEAKPCEPVKPCTID